MLLESKHIINSSVHPFNGTAFVVEFPPLITRTGHRCEYPPVYFQGNTYLFGDWTPISIPTLHSVMISRTCVLEWFSFLFKTTKRHDFLIAVIALYPDNRFELVFVPELFIQFRIAITAVGHEMAASFF